MLSIGRGAELRSEVSKPSQEPLDDDARRFHHFVPRSVHAYWFVGARRFGRGLFQAGDLHSPFGQTVGGGASLNRGSHSYSQRSHRYAVTSFFRIAIVVCAYHGR